MTSLALVEPAHPNHACLSCFFLFSKSSRSRCTAASPLPSTIAQEERAPTPQRIKAAFGSNRAISPFSFRYISRGLNLGVSNPIGISFPRNPDYCVLILDKAAGLADNENEVVNLRLVFLLIALYTTMVALKMTMSPRARVARTARVPTHVHSRNARTNRKPLLPPPHCTGYFGSLKDSGTELSPDLCKKPSFYAEGDGPVAKVYNAIPIPVKRFWFIARGWADVSKLEGVELIFSRVCDVFRPFTYALWKFAWVTTLFTIILPHMCMLTTLVVQRYYKKCNPVYTHRTKMNSSRGREEEQKRQQEALLKADQGADDSAKEKGGKK